MKRCDFKIFIFYWLKFYFKTTQQRQQVSSQYICSVFGKLFFNGKQHAVKLLIHFSWLQVAYDDFSISKFVRLLYISICVYTMFSKKSSNYYWGLYSRVDIQEKWWSGTQKRNILEGFYAKSCIPGLLHSLLELTRTMAAAATAGGGFAGDVPIIHAENLVCNIKSINYRFVSSSSP